jgi:tetratricopeptide (TPR) repeat protein
MKYQVTSLLLLLCLCSPLFAQEQSGRATLSGTVTGTASRPIRDAHIEVRDVLSGHVLAYVYTLPNGTFEVSGLPSGRYVVVALSGLAQAQEQVTLETLTSVNLRMADGPADTGSSRQATVSVAQLKVPDKARDLFRKAEVAFAKHKLEETLRYTERALEVFPNYAQAMTLRAILYMDEGKAEQACALLEKAVHLDSGYAMGYIVLGAAYNVLDRFDDALRSLDRGAALAPASWQAYFEMGKALLGKGEYERALQQVNKAAQYAPDSYAPLHLVRAHAFLGVKNYAGAMTELEQYLGREPNGADSAAARRTLDQVRAFTASAPK